MYDWINVRLYYYYLINAIGLMYDWINVRLYQCNLIRWYIRWY